MTTPVTLATAATRTTDLLTLSADGVELVLDLRRGYPVIVHWGPALGSIRDEHLDAVLSQAFPHADLDDPADAGVLRETSRGFLGRPAVMGHRAGLAWSPQLRITSVTAEESSCALVLVDTGAGIEVTLRYRMLPSGVLLVDAELLSTGRGEYVVGELSTWLPVPDRAAEIIDFGGRWLRERQLFRRPILDGIALRESREGRSGHDATIVQCATTPGADVDRGEVWALALLWSGNTRHMVERLPTGRKSIGAGELLESGEVILREGEVYRAPTVAAAYSADGLDGVGDRIHRWLRSRPEHPTRSRPRPLTLNVWEAVYFDHDVDRLTALAEIAASVGVERFVLDDGWFGSRRDDSSGLGDWTVSPDVWPHGL